MNTLVLALVVKASLLLGAAALINVVLRRRTSAATRHLVWTLALGGALLLPVLSAMVPAWEIPVPVMAETPAAMAERVAVADEEDSFEGMTTGASVTTTAPLPSSPPAEDSRGGSLVPLSISSATLALALYLTGVGLLGLRLAWGRWTLGRLVRQSAEVKDPAWRALLRECEARMGVTRSVRLLRSLDRNMPMAFGVRTPTVLIPAIADTWTEDRRRAVLLHELAHIDRSDCLTQLIAELTCAAYWMHPGVWFAARRLRVEREIACDDRVLGVGTVARDYAGHLLELAYSLGGYRSPALVVSMARPRQLEGRMLAVLDAARNRVTPPRRAQVFGVLVGLALMVPLAAAEAVVAPDPSLRPAMVEWAEPSVAPEAQALASPPPLAALAVLPAAGSVVPVGQTAPPAPPAPPAPRAVRRNEREVEREKEIRLPGTWELRTSDEPGRIYLQLSERPYSQHGFTIALDQLEGLAPSILTAGGAAKFEIRRDAGSIVFDGVFRAGVGAGTFDFTPSPTFAAQMAKRGFASPNQTEQYQLARGNIGFAYLDELNAQKYEKPNLDDLVRAANHGVHLDYLRGMGAAGYRLGNIEALVRTRDHGVTPEYVKALAEEGIKNLSAEDLVRARDHGVTATYVGTMRALGYGGLPLEELIRARDHGVSAEYVKAMAEAGHSRLALGDLVRARDHGVTAEYARAMREAGYGVLSLDEMVKARDHGVSADYVKEMNSLGPGRTSLEELVTARDHGVDADFAKSWRDAGYPTLIADMVRARDNGVSADFISDLKAQGYTRLPVEDLVRLRQHGISARYVREQNAGSRSRLTVDELVRRRNGR